MPGAPYAPIQGQAAPLGRPPVAGTILAIFQVVAEDAHDNYIECRGYEPQNDPTHTHLHDPYTHPETTPINVAKPYGVRGTFPYQVGQVVVAARILTKYGYTPGKAATTVGHPTDLDEEIEILLDDNDVAISWLDLGGSVSRDESIRGSFEGTLSQGSFVTCQQIAYDENDDQVFTGWEFDAWDFFFNLGESVTGKYKVKASWDASSERYLIDELTCVESDTVPPNPSTSPSSTPSSSPSASPSSTPSSSVSSSPSAT